jgi:hypothetical protein
MQSQIIIIQKLFIAAQNKLHIRKAREKYNNIGAERAEQMFTVRPVDGCAALRKKQ